MLKTPRGYALLIAVIITGAYALVIVSIDLFSRMDPVYNYATIGGIIFLIAYTVVRVFFTRFVQQKILFIKQFTPQCYRDGN